MRYIFILTLFCLAFSGCAEKAPSGKIAVKINNYSMTADEFNNLFLESNISEDTPKSREAFLDNTINRKLMLL